MALLKEYHLLRKIETDPNCSHCITPLEAWAEYSGYENLEEYAEEIDIEIDTLDKRDYELLITGKKIGGKPIEDLTGTWWVTDDSCSKKELKKAKAREITKIAVIVDGKFSKEGKETYINDAEGYACVREIESLF